MRPACVREGRPTLARAGRALTDLQKAAPGRSRVGLPCEWIFGLTGLVLREGQRAAATALLWSFDAYLKPGKLVDLKKEDVIPPVMRCKWYG